MAYRLRVAEDDDQPDTGEFKFFDNFMDESGFIGSNENIDYFLKPYNAKNVFMEPFIEFETEEDAIWFILRWS